MEKIERLKKQLSRAKEQYAQASEWARSPNLIEQSTGLRTLPVLKYEIEQLEQELKVLNANLFTRNTATPPRMERLRLHSSIEALQGFMQPDPSPIQKLAVEYFTQDNQGIDYPFYIAVQQTRRPYQDQWSNTFLTYSGYYAHIDLNGHHYDNPKPCVVYANRNPEIVGLVKMLFEVFKEIATKAQMERLFQITNLFR